MNYKIYIWIKTLLSKLLRCISPLETELKVFNDHFVEGNKTITWKALQENGIHYKKEKHDLQKSVDITIRDGGGDCEDIARIFQVAQNVKNNPAYLVSMWGIDIFDHKIGHAFCVAKDVKGEKANYMAIDYNDIFVTSSLRTAIEQVRFKYKVNLIKGVVIQDINFKIVKGI
jgi:hypothetical protein